MRRRILKTVPATSIPVTFHLCEGGVKCVAAGPLISFAVELPHGTTEGQGLALKRRFEEVTGIPMEVKLVASEDLRKKPVPTARSPQPRETPYSLEKCPGRLGILVQATERFAILAAMLPVLSGLQTRLEADEVRLPDSTVVGQALISIPDPYPERVKERIRAVVGKLAGGNVRFSDET